VLEVLLENERRGPKNTAKRARWQPKIHAAFEAPRSYSYMPSCPRLRFLESNHWILNVRHFNNLIQ
jgi:hypothetical protein